MVVTQLTGGAYDRLCIAIKDISIAIMTTLPLRVSRALQPSGRRWVPIGIHGNLIHSGDNTTIPALSGPECFLKK